MASVKQPAVAGFFYPGEPHTLKRTVQNLLMHAKNLDVVAPKAIIAPHAGYVYSGPIAATIYKTLMPHKDSVKRVVLLGPAHNLSFTGIATTACEAFLTPLGEIKIDLATINKTLELANVRVLEQAFDREHSLEVQLPFLQTILSHFTLLPFLVGNANPQDVTKLLLELWGGSETLIVISSDLSHYYDYATAQKFDNAAAEAITHLAVDQLHDHQACGRLPIKGLLLAAAKLNLQAQLLDLRNSGDTAGPKDRVVGYGACHFKEKINV